MASNTGYIEGTAGVNTGDLVIDLVDARAYDTFRSCPRPGR
jgi:hypothetical protein